jgi:DNA-3-methyladenine glycosylase II
VSGFALRPEGPYALAASIAFLEGFTPAAYQGDGGVLRFAFVADAALTRAAWVIRMRLPISAQAAAS